MLPTGNVIDDTLRLIWRSLLNLYYYPALYYSLYAYPRGIALLDAPRAIL